jgi:hypothetical protein
MSEQEYQELERSIEERRKLKQWAADYERNRKERLADAACDRALGTLPRSVTGSRGVLHSSGVDFAMVQRTACGEFH